MNELDFSGKQALVIGGSSGIGNGIAQAYRARGATVHVCGTRATAADYGLCSAVAPSASVEAMLTMRGHVDWRR